MDGKRGRKVGRKDGKCGEFRWKKEWEKQGKMGNIVRKSGVKEE